MAKKAKSYSDHIRIKKGTSIGRHPIKSTMNKKIDWGLSYMKYNTKTP